MSLYALVRLNNRWTISHYVLLLWSNEYKVMSWCCSKVHLEPLLPDELLSSAIFSEVEHIQMAASKEPSPAPESALFYAPNAWCQDISVRHCGESTQQLLAWAFWDLTCWVLDKERIWLCVTPGKKFCLPQTWKKFRGYFKGFNWA